MATHSSVLAWRIPWTKEPGGLQSVGSQRIEHFQPTLTSIHDYWKNHKFDYTDCKVMSLLFNMLSRCFILFLPRSKHLLISWLQSLSAVILELKKIKSVTVSTFCPSICHEVMGPDAIILVFFKLSFKPAFSFTSFSTSIKRVFSFSSLSAITVVLSAYLKCCYFSRQS